MAEVLLSPGVLANENNSTFIQQQPIQAGAALLGPTVKGPVGIPTVCTSYSDYLNKFGAIVESGSNEYTYFTSVAAYGYFQQGGNTLLVTRIVSGSYTSATSSIIANSDTSASFTLETIAEGAVQNSTSTEGSAGQLADGTRDNLRWEVVSPNTSSGTFSLLIRRGDDITTSKTVLETWTDLSLDPNASNYISRVIGDQSLTVRQDGSTYYTQLSGSYANASRYVRVKSVATPTLNYFDNAGTAKSAFTSSIPVAASGAFGGALGTDFNGITANFNENINSTNTQGLVADNYTTSLNLLANQDEYKYNLIVAPGLYNVDYSSPLTTMVNNSQTRGDNIAVIDLVKYGQTITSVTSQAAGKDSSYAATYWPWVQTIDPDLGDQVWVPASTMIPGVYAFNDNSSEAWFAPAGLSRGGLSTVIRAERKLTNGNRDTLYQANVNPIATFPNAGVVVFGQKTLQKKASATDRVNVRRLLIELKSYISQIADNLVFEQNTIATRNNFLSQVNPYLESVQQRQGLYAFKVIMDETNNTPDVIDRNQLVGQIFIQPTRTAEFIYLDFNILPTGATFPA
jgi:phage tail sheath protein FI